MDIWKRAQIAARWTRDSFASLFVTSWLYLILWGVVGIAFTVLLYIDGVFSRSLAPDSIEPLSFQAMGWAYRFFAAAFLMAAARCVFKGIKGKWTFRLLGIFASAIVCLHAFGFGFEALSERREQAMALRDVSGVQEQSIADQRAFLEQRKAEIDTALASQVAALDAEIEQYITDGVNNDFLADETRERRSSLQDQAAADKRALDEQIMQLVVSGSQARTETIETKANAQPWHPLFVGLAQMGLGFNATWEPSDKRIYIAAIIFVIFWVLLAESLVIFLPERIYVMHLHDAERAKRSDAARRGHETRKEKVKIEDDGYWPERVVKALNAPKTYTLKGLCKTYFGTILPGELREHLYRQIQKRVELPKADPVLHKRAIERGLLSSQRPTYLMQQHIDFIFSEGDYAPEEQQANGHDQSPVNGAADDNTDDSQSSGVPATT